MIGLHIQLVRVTGVMTLNKLDIVGGVDLIHMENMKVENIDM